MNKEKDLQYLQEFSLFSNLEQYDTVLGEAVYSSEKVKNDFKNMISKSKLRSVSDNINYLIDKNEILPCYTSKNFFMNIMNKYFSNRISKYAYGFYVKSNQRIYIFMANANKYFFFSNKEKLIDTLIHELMHYSCAKHTSVFLSLFKNDIYKFYQTSFDKIFDETNVLDKHSVQNLVSFLIKNFELKVNLNYSALYNYANFLEKIVNVEDDVNKKESIVATLGALKVYLMSPPNFIRSFSSNENIKQMVLSLFYGYRSIGVNERPDTVPVQELIFPSEIIAMQSMYDFNNKHMNLLKRI